MLPHAEQNDEQLVLCARQAVHMCPHSRTPSQPQRRQAAPHVCAARKAAMARRPRSVLPKELLLPALPGLLGLLGLLHSSASGATLQMAGSLST